MNRIDKLITKLCPDGVQILKLGKLESNGIVKLGRGDVISKTDLANHEGDFPVYSSSASDIGVFGYYGKYMFDDIRITWSIDGGGKFFYRNAHKYSVTNVCGWLKVLDEKVLNPKYLYYVLISVWGTRIYNYTVKAHPSVIKEDYLIPVPPLEIQNEIVSILDTFSELETELEAELEARKKQYSYYRFKLVDNNKSKTVTLKDITEATFWIMPSTPTYDELEGIAYITSKNLSKGSIDYKGSKRISQKSYDEISKNRPIKQDDLLIGMIGTIGEIARVKKNDLPFYGQNMYLVRFNQELIDINYFLHYFDSELMKDYFNSIKNNSAQGYLKAEHIDNILIPLPPLSKQKEIAGVLDIYSDLINNIDIGIPAELMARKQQYEYYRDKLLTFKKLESA